MADNPHGPAPAVPAAHLDGMTTVRVPAGNPDGGRFAATLRPEAEVSLGGPGPVPAFPTPADLAHENRHQRAEEYAARLHAIATHPAADAHTRRMAAVSALEKVSDARGRFLSLPEDDGEAQSYVADAILDDTKVDAALARVGTLHPDEAHTFGDRVAGALYDLQVAERDERCAQVATTSAPARPVDESGWPVGLPTAPPETDEDPGTDDRDAVDEHHCGWDFDPGCDGCRAAAADAAMSRF